MSEQITPVPVLATRRFLRDRRDFAGKYQEFNDNLRAFLRFRVGARPFDAYDPKDGVMVGMNGLRRWHAVRGKALVLYAHDAEAVRLFAVTEHDGVEDDHKLRIARGFMNGNGTDLQPAPMLLADASVETAYEAVSSGFARLRDENQELRAALARAEADVAASLTLAQQEEAAGHHDRRATTTLWAALLELVAQHNPHVDAVEVVDEPDEPSTDMAVVPVVLTEPQSEIRQSAVAKGSAAIDQPLVEPLPELAAAVVDTVSASDVASALTQSAAPALMIVAPEGKEFGPWLKRERMRRGLTLTGLAAMIGSSGQLIGQWERGIHGPGAAKRSAVLHALASVGPAFSLRRGDNIMHGDRAVHTNGRAT